MTARMATMQMQMQMKRKKHRKPMMDQRRMWRTAGIVALTFEQVISMGMSLRMMTMQIRMRRKSIASR
jgi:hypothetical protein